jgi:hypothetical protein
MGEGGAVGLLRRMLRYGHRGEGPGDWLPPGTGGPPPVASCQKPRGAEEEAERPLGCTPGYDARWCAPSDCRPMSRLRCAWRWPECGCCR